MSGAVDRLRRFAVWKGPALLYAAVIFIMSALPGGEIPEMPFRFGDKLVHALEYGLFGIFLYRAFRFPSSHPNPLRMTLAFGILYAASDEIHQFFVPGRFCSVADFFADCAGLAFFAFLSSRIHRAPIEPPAPDAAPAAVEKTERNGGGGSRTG